MAGKMRKAASGKGLDPEYRNNPTIKTKTQRKHGPRVWTDLPPKTHKRPPGTRRGLVVSHQANVKQNHQMALHTHQRVTLEKRTGPG